MTEKSRTVNRWYAAYSKGTDFDSWGQLVEAADQYSKLSKELKKATVIENQMFQHDQKKLLLKISVCLELRANTLLSTQEFVKDQISYDDIKKVGEVLKNLMVGWNEPFPVRVELPSRVGTTENEPKSINNEEFVLAGEGGTLLPRIPYEQGFHRLTIRIDKIGLKDAASHINSFFSVHVKDNDCVSVAMSQDTPVSNTKDGNYIIFGIEVEIQKHIEKLPKGTAIFFELKHYKPKKNMVSTKCFGFMEQDELRSGEACIELYRKPTDYRRKKLNLLTSKPLYLYLTLTVHDD
ncbi:axin interactor, dorsalization-associated protein [Exaiptasia diaphana]|uniref:C2 Aida-type domain-containing protein n=1 Tax=Exaiptasia diaphana TaxID=2652724 RepID=A0A913Y237_EXADI|nr:axin interactor, dorsalization-associated protein [Exaiptasia diaphana]KXJ19840.1 Axin interactor, dorsalization-associated protein [Exaiptasia diaphana]